MCYYYDRRDTDERCLPLRLGNYSVALGEERDGVISYFYRQPFHRRLCINFGVLRGGGSVRRKWCSFRVCDRVQDTTFRQNMQPIRNI